MRNMRTNIVSFMLAPIMTITLIKGLSSSPNIGLQWELHAEIYYQSTLYVHVLSHNISDDSFFE